MWNRVTGLTDAFKVFGAVEHLIADRHVREPHSLPDLTQDDTLIAASDYSGTHADSKYDVITCVLTTETGWLRWEHLRRQVRHTYRLDRRRVAYTKLNDSRKVRALASFLSAANSVEGVLCSLVVEKNLPSAFNADGTAWAADPALDGGHLYKPAVFEQMLRVATLLALLVAGMSRRGQRLLWVTDEDQIASNAEQHTKVTTALANMIALHTGGAIHQVRSITTASDPGTLAAEDLAAIPDLAGGALTDLFSSLHRRDAMPTAHLTLPAPQDLSGKALQVLYWLRETAHPLRRMIFVVRRGARHGDVNITPIALT